MGTATARWLVVLRAHRFGAFGSSAHFQPRVSDDSSRTPTTHASSHTSQIGVSWMQSAIQCKGNAEGQGALASFQQFLKDGAH